MSLSKMAKIGIVVALVLIITIPTVIILSLPQAKGTGPKVTFFGPTVSQNVSVYYSEIIDTDNLDQKINSSFYFVKSNGAVEGHNYTGVSLWELIQYSGVNYGAATAVRFIGYDGYASPAFPIKLIEQNPELAIFAYEQDSVSLLTAANGPYRAIINHSLIAPKISSKYAASKVTQIQFLNYPDWNITICGSAVAQNITIYYCELMTYGYTMLNELINYTNVIRNYTGVSVKSILSKEIPSNYVINTTPITSIRFIGSDLYATQLVSYPWIYLNETDVLVAYARDGVLLDPTDPGVLNSVVDYGLTAPTSSNSYRAKYLAYIELS